MARLVLINGAPGSGKSTLAQMYADAHPLTLALDIDVFRALLGRWLDHPTQAGLLARTMAVQMARVHLAAGRDVLVPQFLGRVEFILELEQLCQQLGADFVELALLSSPQEAIHRFVQRSGRPETPAHRDAAALRERSGGISELPAMYDQLLQVIASRPGTRTVITVAGEVEQTYRDLVAHLEQRLPERSATPAGSRSMAPSMATNERAAAAAGELELVRRLNLANWNERASAHGQDRYYDTAGFLAGASSLRENERRLAGDVAGRDLLHLQCHLGLDTLSWARLGARATGLDFSEVAINRARALAKQAGIDATFIQADVLDSPADVDLVEAFDLVVATYGVFTWIGDLDAWARSAVRALRPTGRLVIVDLHPLTQMIEQRDPLVVDFPYADDGPHRAFSESTYANPDIILSAQDTTQWAHSLGEIVTAITGAGLRINQLHEHLSTDRDDRPGVLIPGNDRRWRLQLWAQDLPVLFSLTATKT